jgi:hypothetical protein
MTRNGKIARLPLDLREQLNQRLRQGQKARQLIQWLNGLPEVQAVLAAEFKGQPIIEVNLSRWKNGGYQAWLEEQNSLDSAIAMMEKSSGLRELNKEELSRRVNLILHNQIALEVKRLDSVLPGSRKTRVQRALVDRYVALQRVSLEKARLGLEERKLDFLHERSLAKACRHSPKPPKSAEP